jgi:hypothetical protein
MISAEKSNNTPNTATDFQPPTQNPQTNEANLQQAPTQTTPGATNQADLAQPTVKTLTVQTDKGSSGEIASSPITAAGNGPLALAILLVVFIGVIALLLQRVLARTTVLETAVEEVEAPHVTEVVTPKVTKKKSSKKKPPLKKRTSAAKKK